LGIGKKKSNDFVTFKKKILGMEKNQTFLLHLEKKILGIG
jgi:hypothetical protein